MKKWLSYIAKKVIESLIINGVRFLIGLAVIGAASIPVVQAIKNASQATVTVEKWLLILPYLIMLLIAFILIFYLILRFRLMPHLSWDYIFGLNQHTICYIDKSNLEFTKKLNIIPLSNCVNQASYDYTWTGSKITSVTLKEIDGNVTVNEDASGNISNKGILSINFNEYLRVLRKQECDVTFQLSNENNTMEPKLIITVKRPTLKSLLRVVTNPGVQLKNVNASIYNIFGDRKNSFKIIPLYSMKFGNHLSAQTYYEWEIKHPKLFTKYEITWEIV
jgi:hypothetical protein